MESEDKRRLREMEETIRMKNKQNIYFLEELYSAIQNRAKGSKKNSYTKSLLKKGKNKIQRSTKYLETSPLLEKPPLFSPDLEQVGIFQNRPKIKKN